MDKKEEYVLSIQIKAKEELIEKESDIFVLFMPPALKHNTTIVNSFFWNDCIRYQIYCFAIEFAFILLIVS